MLTERISSALAVAGAGMAQECTLAFMKASGLPPGPTTRRLGQMAEWLARPNTYAARQRERFGDVFTARIDPIPWVMLGDPGDVRTVFTAGPQRTNAGEANEILRPTLGPHSLLLLDGDEHMRQRKLMLPAFHGERIDRYRQIMREATERAIAAGVQGVPTTVVDGTLFYGDDRLESAALLGGRGLGGR